MPGEEKTEVSGWSIHVIDSAALLQSPFWSHSILLNTSMFPRPRAQTLFCLSVKPVLVLTLAEAAGKPINWDSVVYIHILNHWSPNRINMPEGIESARRSASSVHCAGISSGPWVSRPELQYRLHLHSWWLPLWGLGYLFPPENVCHCLEHSKEIFPNA